jgi:hypothetical protein
MNPRRLVVAALLLLGLAVVTLEESYVHSDDGCAVETHCSACLLQLGTTGDLPSPIVLPRAGLTLERVGYERAPAHDEATPRLVPSRGPPLA